MKPLFVCLVCLFSLAAIRPTSRPADPLADSAADAARQKTLAAFAGQIEPKLKTELEQGDAVNYAEVLHLAGLREFGRYFGRLTELTGAQTDTLAWLAKEPDVLPALLMSMTIADPPDRVIEVLRGLRSDHRTTIGEFPELAAAVCVVWDAPERFGTAEDVKVDSAEPSRVFEHFSRAADRLALDPRRLPRELLIYVVDLHLRNEEIGWATRYGPRPSVAGTFQSVPFRPYVGYDRNTRQMSDQAYLLPNILRRGGSVADAAYFAAEIGKANGIPATTCTPVQGGDGAAWTSFLQFGSRPTWDFESARNPDHAGWIGQTTNPQTGSTMTEPELALSAGLFSTPARERMVSNAILKSIDLTLTAQRFDWFRRAIEKSPANLAAWNALADWAEKEKLDDEGMKPVEALMQKHLGKRWPELMTVLRLSMLESRGTLEFDRGMDRAAAAAKDFPNLVAMVRLAQIDRYRRDKRFKEAETALLNFLQQQPTLSPSVALGVTNRLDEILRMGDGQLERLREIYRRVYEAIPRPLPSRHARSSAYYQLGMKYAQVVEELKESQAATMLRTRMENLVIPSPEQ